MREFNTKTIVFNGGLKLADQVVRIITMPMLDETMMHDLIRQHIEKNNEDPQEIVPPTYFAFDMTALNQRDDDYISTCIKGYAQSDYIDIKWVATLDHIHRPLEHYYGNHPVYIFYMQED